MIVTNLELIPKLYEQENNENPILHAKLYIPECGWEWYIMEYSPLQKLCFGYVVGDENELGYFSLDELESLQYKFGVEVIQDTSFTPIGLKELQDERAS